MLSGLSVIEILGLFFTYFKQMKKFFAEKFINKKNIEVQRISYMNFWPQLISFSLKFLVHRNLKIINIFLKLFTLNVSRPFLSQWKSVILIVNLSKYCKLMLWTCPRKLKKVTNRFLDFSSLQSFLITQVNFLSILSYTLLFCQ